MPKGSASLLDQIQTQGKKVMAAIEAEIAERQGQIDDLREQASRWLAAMGGAAKKRRGRPPGSGKKAGAAGAAHRADRSGPAKKAGKAKRTSPPVDWEKVLAKLPTSFTMDDVAKVTPSLKEHRQTRVIAVARWSRSGAITKVGEGKYRKGGKKAA